MDDVARISTLMEAITLVLNLSWKGNTKRLENFFKQEWIVSLWDYYSPNSEELFVVFTHCCRSLYNNIDNTDKNSALEVISIVLNGLLPCLLWEELDSYAATQYLSLVDTLATDHNSEFQSLIGFFQQGGVLESFSTSQKSALISLIISKHTNKIASLSTLISVIQTKHFFVRESAKGGPRISLIQSSQQEGYLGVSIDNAFFFFFQILITF